jgi:hypothetical protein
MQTAAENPRVSGTMANQFIDWMEQTLWPRGDRRDIWMILDGARDRRVYSCLLSSYLEYSCLYAGDLPPALEVAAPHLVQLEYQDRYSRRILEYAWGNSWGVLLKCDASLAQLRRHLRHFLIARGPRNQPLVFRYYDPRVLRVYLPVCFAEELRTLFGAIECFWTDGAAPGELLEFTLDGDRLVRRTLHPEIPVSNGAPKARGALPSAPFTGRMPRRYPPLSIRQAQLTAFSRAEVEKFENWMVGHLKKFFPRQSHAAGEARLRETIQHGIRRAAAYGITTRRDVSKYIDLALVLGPDFDTGPRSRWASQILTQTAAPAAKMQALLRAAKQRLGNR